MEETRRCLPAPRSDGSDATGKACVIGRRLHCLNVRTQRCTHVRNHAWRSHRCSADYMVAAGPLERWAGTQAAPQETERRAYVTVPQLMHKNVGSPTGREPYGDGALVVVRGRPLRTINMRSWYEFRVAMARRNRTAHDDGYAESPARSRLRARNPPHDTTVPAGHRS